MKTIAMMAVSIALAAHTAVAAPAAPLARDSVYQADIMLLNDRAERFAWRDQRGQPRIVSMFCTSCKVTCPMLIDGARAVQAGLTPEERARLNVTFISLDPARDKTRALAQLRVDRELDRVQWTLARVEPADVRMVAAILGVELSRARRRRLQPHVGARAARCGRARRRANRAHRRHAGSRVPRGGAQDAAHHARARALMRLA